MWSSTRVGWIRLRETWPVHLEKALAATWWFLSPVAGLAWWYYQPDLGETGAWQWGAFQGLGSMAGFMLAALALVQTVSDSPSMASWRRHAAWNSLINSMTNSMWWWTGGATLALACWLVSSPALTSVFLVAMVAGVLNGIRAMCWVAAIARRFRTDVG